MESSLTEQLTTPAAETSAVVGTNVSVLRGYYELTKPGITQMVVFTAAAAYYLAVPSLG
ncbi:MAG: hypothetical protein JNL32_11600, partial [Candidatus Kapabacteria bacterium]|nr:hypothetical protein [Candidatus Kapabacteria bacterium]